MDGKGVGVPVPAEARYSPVHVVQTGSGTHPASYLMGTWGSLSWDKEAGREADHTSPASAEVKNMYIYTLTFIHLHGVVLN
jgi:hypothetical protein